MKKITTTFVLVSLIAMIMSSCVHADKHCKANNRKAKKNNIGWKY